MMKPLQIRPFRATHPPTSDAPKVSCPPYDVVNRDEARGIAKDNVDSFMRVIRSEIELQDDCSPYDNGVYEAAKKNFEALLESGALIQDKKPSLYLYRQCVGEHHQVGLVACCHINDYKNNRIKKHEKTRKAKEDDRTKHVLSINANSGPVFLAYRGNPGIDKIIVEEMNKRPMFHFVADDGVTHTGWRVECEDELLKAFESIGVAYIADGHHRSESAARAAMELANTNPGHDGSEEYNWFLAVLFPSSQLHILPYNRVVVDLNGHTPEEIISQCKELGTLKKTDSPTPSNTGSCCIYLGKNVGWFQLNFSEINTNDPIASLDVDLLQQRILSPILGIDDPRSDTRIDFVGGIRGTDELEHRVDDGDAAIAFSMFPTTIDQLLDVADAHLIMPPKSTWFEPKLRSGLFVHELS